MMLTRESLLLQKVEKVDLFNNIANS